MIKRPVQLGEITAAGGATQAGVDGKVAKDNGHDAVGSICLARHVTVNTAITPGSTYAGSVLRAAGHTDNGSALSVSFSATALTGTWRALGYAAAGSGLLGSTVFQRIA